MSRKIKSTRMKRKRNHTIKKIKKSIGGALSDLGHDAGATVLPPDKESREYTIILLENSHGDLKQVKDYVESKIDEIKKRIEKEMQNGEEKNNFKVNGSRIIESGLHVGEELINGGMFKKIRGDTSHKKYLGVVLDLTHFLKETFLDGSVIIQIFRDIIVKNI